MRLRHLIRVTGIVQGVGFRPFVYRLALEHGLGGFVLNDGEGVFLEAEGEAEALRRFDLDLKERAPAAARVDQVLITPAPPAGYAGFEIRASRESVEKVARVSPDLATCPDCRREAFDPSDRRHCYAFTNCTNCGPRFTIIRDVPYDRAQTTMSGFVMCRQCEAEYREPSNRRFHAEPTACPRCGPALSLYNANGTRLPVADPLNEVRRLLRQGNLVAIKGLGGYHLACDATNELAVRTLRNRKVREEKPFALMAADLAAVRLHARVTPVEARLLTGPEAPIVLLRRRRDCRLPDSIAPGQAHLGFFLPYTPLLHLLLARGAGDGGAAGETAVPRPGRAPSGTPGASGGGAGVGVTGAGSAGGGAAGEDAARGGLPGGNAADVPPILVMTSGNRSDEPIAYRDEEAMDRLGDIADYFLGHNRPIHLRCEDSVTRVFRGRPQILRRARGYVPRVTRLPWPVPGHVLATGPHLKNTFALAKGFDCYVGPHNGDLENLETYRAFEEGIRHFERLFEIRPAVVAFDLHPDYLASRYALSLDMEESIGCQHHEAHVASVMGENSIEEPVIGVALDGTGYGRDGTTWGGEFFVVRDRSFLRAAHLRPVPMPGGDQAAREPWRAAAAYLAQGVSGSDAAQRARLLLGVPRERLALVERMLERGLNCPLSSGAGRAFDAAASLILGRHRSAYEGQGPMELEQVATRPGRGGLPPPFGFGVERSEDGAPWQIDLGPAFSELAALIAEGRTGKPELARRFHSTMAAAVVAVASALAERESIRDCCLSGGVFQNQILLGAVTDGLEERGLRVHRNRDLPPNDGGISFGQVVLASWWAFSGMPGTQGEGRRQAGVARGRG